MSAAVETLAQATQTPETFRVTNPATGAVLREVPIHDAAHVRAETARVRAAQKRWAELPIEARCEKIRDAAGRIVERAEEIADVITSENGKVRTEALLLDVAPTLAVMHYFADNAPAILAPQRLRLALARHKRSYLSFQPMGVIGAISPWNFPFFLPASDVAMSLIAGNGVVLKPSEVTPLSSLILKDCYDQAGIDPDLFRVVTGLGPTGAAVIDAMPDHVVFTGSVPTGRRIGIACAERMIGCTLELGGKAPAVVLDDADVDRAANAIVYGGFANAGQICASVERVYAAAPVYDRLVEQVSEKARALRVGAPAKDAVVDVGAMTFPRQKEIVERLVADARAKGARVTAGGSAPDRPGLFYNPTVIADCNHDMEVMTAEIFGPVVPFMKVESEDEAVRLANTSHLGLGAYVFTRDRERGCRVAEKLEVGSVMINDVLAHAGMPEMPWGGIKQSGLGVVRSDRGLQALCHARHVNVDRLPVSPARDPYWFPYSPATEAGILKFLKATYGRSTPSKLLRWFLT